MRRQGLAILAVVAALGFIVACGTSDMGITTKVKSKLETDRDLNASQITVNTQNKVVTLAGAVDTSASQDRAVADARTVEGVTAVVNNISVSPGAAPAPAGPPESQANAAAPDDTAITEAVKEKLLSQPAAVAEKITVDTHQGVVTLSGTVKTPQEKDQMIQIARGTQGVQRVEDHLSVGTS